ncbi:MAG: indolepyruvate ferredoxin oxidoreductase subunit alpha [Candidatus Cloacimonetes bacterium]|nr:indolepyruvate ferredoxin oxidoreductase subunit alpha [Candidatus Cloacimonadota bacterium]MBS3767746.1 indolepyruvate ferredoxin oxidoreductase subunit alpha [Candidatus Cloacimonadota bacterium]
MDKLLLLGDEAVGQGALDAGLSGAFGYPGTPSTEIIEYIQENEDAMKRKIHFSWSANEKTSMEEAMGLSYAGKRALVTMKHVGLNVAADAYVNSAITGANGGIIVAVADDPSMHSSQNEQDSRFYGNFAQLPVMEPCDQQEAYDMPREAFALSEKYKVPVMLRLTTRLAHSRAGIIRKEVIPENEMHRPDDPNQFMLLPAFARENYKDLLEKQSQFIAESEESKYNVFHNGDDKGMGIIACGLGYNYLMENVQGSDLDYPILKIGQYPLPRKQIEKITSECDSVLVIEEGMPLLEEKLRGYLDNCLNVKGRLDGTLPRYGELNPQIVASALGLSPKPVKDIPKTVKGRPPELCKGCPHRDTFVTLNKAMEKYGKGHVFSDIGCYTLGFLPPFNAINSCVCMGASVSMAVGAAEAGFYPSVAVIGDSTFGHSGMTGLLDAVNKESNVVIMILDNNTVAMTGMQDSAVEGSIEKICAGLGVEKEHIRVFKPLKPKHDENVKIIEEELEYSGVSVIIPRRECIHLRRKRKK